jgi:hypothetical protein
MEQRNRNLIAAGITIPLTTFCLLLTAAAAVAQPAAPTVPDADEGWRITIYPVLAWIPSGIDIDITLPPSDADGGVIGQIIDSRFDGAFLGGFSAAKGAWRVDADGLWAAVGGDRLELPVFSVDADGIYLHASGGRRLIKDLYLTAGVRRLAVKYVIDVNALGVLERKPGVWDPLVGLGWHTQKRHFEVHAILEGGGFGVGSEVEVAASFRLDWKPIPHFGFTGGYQFLYFDVDKTLLGRPFRVKQTLQGPIVGVGFSF